MRTLKNESFAFSPTRTGFVLLIIITSQNFRILSASKKKCAEFFENRKFFEKLFPKRSPKLSYRFPSYKVSSKFSNLKKGAQFLGTHEFHTMGIRALKPNCVKSLKKRARIFSFTIMFQNITLCVKFRIF